MGRRAKKAPVVTKKRATLAKRFKCPFCSNEDVVECKMDFKANIGSLSCRLCGASHQMTIHHLHEPIDVFSEWLDECEAAANPHKAVPQEEDIRPRYQQEEEEEDDDESEEEAAAPPPPPPKKKKVVKKAKAKASMVDLGLGDSSDDDSDDE